MKSFRLPSVLVLSVVATAAAAGPATPAQCRRHVDVRNLMTVSQFDQAGLSKLSQQQLAALNAWLSRYLQTQCNAQASASAPQTPARSALPGPVVTPQPKHGSAASSNVGGAASFGAPPQSPPATPSQIESRIIGDFHGWTGDTIFRLENGQIWEQAGPGYFETDLKNPKVKIKKLLIGYVLMVDGYAKEVFVRRIR